MNVSKNTTDTTTKYGRRCINSKHSNMIKDIHTTAKNQADIQLCVEGE